MSDINKYIIELEKEILEKQKELDNLKTLKAKYPDLQKQTSRWNKISYASKSVNDKVNDYDWRFNCSCCADSPAEIFPFINTPEGKIYSDPSCFIVGERDNYIGYRAVRLYDNWQEELQKENIPEALIKRIQNLFSSYGDEDNDIDE